MSITLRDNPKGLPDIDQHPYLVKCDSPDCAWLVSAANKEAAIKSYTSHLCPWFYDMTERIADMAKGMTQFQKMFQLLDGAMDLMAETRTEFAATQGDADQSVAAHLGLELSRLKGFMQGLAETIVITMMPIFPDTRSVAIEAKKRYDARVAGTTHQSPGVDYTWKPSGVKGGPIPEFIPDSKRTEDDPAPRRPAASRRSGAGVASVEARAAAVDEATRASISQGMSAGVFSAAELASAFGLKEDVVQYIFDTMQASS